MPRSADNYSRRFFIALLFSLPAFIFGAFMYFFSRDEYYFMTFTIVSISFLLASFFLGWEIPSLMKKERSISKSLWLTLRGAAAWMPSLLILTILNFTPLCVGQNSGDGSNDVGLCFFYTLLTSFFYSLLIFPMLIINAVIISKIFSGFKGSR